LADVRPCVRAGRIALMGERLQKILANTGLGSRRELESWIAEGLVRVNGREAKLGDRAELNDDLTVKGRYYKVVADEQQTRRVLMYHKPLGEITTRDDPEKRKTVFDNLPRLHHGRWIAVGRLDINTLGLLLLTNDGELANTLMHPSGEFERQYAVRINGRPSTDVLDRLRTGVELEDGMAKFERLVAEGGEGSNQWYRVSVREGRNRIVRRLWESQDLQVSRLIRTRYGPINLPRWLARGKVHEMLPSEVSNLSQAAGLGAKPVNKLMITAVHPRDRRRAKASKRPSDTKQRTASKRPKSGTRQSNTAKQGKAATRQGKTAKRS